MKKPFLPLILVSILAAAETAHSQGKKGPPDHGMVLATAMEAAPHKLKDTTNLADTTNYVFRGRAITLNQERTVHLCFDTDLMRVAGAWVGKYPAYQAFKNMGPGVEGQMTFSTRPGPGWTGGKEWKDPRPHGEGPLPREHAHYKGLYLCEDRVVLSYTVGTAKVLELPGCIVQDKWNVVTRTIQVDALKEDQALLVCEEGKGKATVKIEGPIAFINGPEGIRAAGVTNPPKGFSWNFADGRLAFLPGEIAKETTFRIALARVPEGEDGKQFAELLKAKVEDPSTFIKGGAARWTKEFTTKGIPGVSPSEPYVLDQFLLPDGNPYSPLTRPGAFDFFPDGRCALCTWDGDVWIISGLDANLEKITWKRFAAGLQQPLGLKVIDGIIYTAGRDQVTRLHDLNGDGEADFFENFNNDAPLTLQRHEFVMDLQTDKKGNLYYCRSGHYVQSPSGANCCVYKLPPDGSKLEVVARGFREPNGMGVGPDGTLTVGDNEGNGVPQTPLYHLKQGAFYGYTPQPKPGAAGGSWKYTEKPIVWLPKNVDRSAGGQEWVTSKNFGPLEGQLLHTSYGHCVLFQVLLDKKAEPWQGAVWKFPVTFYSGVMRARFSPKDGHLYLCGLRGWDTTSTKDGQFCRVRYTGKKVPIPVGFEVTRKGIDLTFSEKLDKTEAEDEQNWAGEWADPIGKTLAAVKGKQEMPITSLRLSPDGKTVSIDLERVLPVSNFTVQYRIRGTDGGRCAGEVHGTIHRVP